MGSIAEYNNTIADYIFRFMSEYQLQQIEAMSDAASDTDKWYVENLINIIMTTFDEAISSFYASYSPLSYDRENGLYEILSISRDADGLGFVMEYEPSNMKIARRDEDDPDGLRGYIYETVFKLGYHGGARHSGSGKVPPHPHPGVAYWRTGRYFCEWYPYGAAQYTPSPYEEINRRLDDYEYGGAALEDYENHFTELYNYELSKRGI